MIKELGTLQSCTIKLCVMIITVGIGLWCGNHDSYKAFYIAAFVQAVNNIHDAYPYLKMSYCKLVLIFQLLSIILGTCVLVLSVLSFAGAKVSNFFCLFCVTGALSVPICLYVIGIILLFFQK